MILFWNFHLRTPLPSISIHLQKLKCDDEGSWETYIKIKFSVDWYKSHDPVLCIKEIWENILKKYHLKKCWKKFLRHLYGNFMLILKKFKETERIVGRIWCKNLFFCSSKMVTQIIYYIVWWSSVWSRVHICMRTGHVGMANPDECLIKVVCLAFA